MAGDSRLSARFGANTEDFHNGIVAVNRELKLVESSFRATASTMSDWSNESAGLEARLSSLNKSIELQKEKVNALQYKLEDMKKVHGENSVEAQNAGIEFNKESKRLNELQKELGQTETSLKSMKGTTGGVKGAFKDLGTQFDALKQQVPVLGTAFNLLSNPIALAAAAAGAFAAITKKSIGEFVAYNQQIREMTLATGLGAEEISRIIQEQPGPNSVRVQVDESIPADTDRQAGGDSGRPGPHCRGLIDPAGRLRLQRADSADFRHDSVLPVRSAGDDRSTGDDRSAGKGLGRPPGIPQCAFDAIHGFIGFHGGAPRVSVIFR